MFHHLVQRSVLESCTATHQQYSMGTANLLLLASTQRCWPYSPDNWAWHLVAQGLAQPMSWVQHTCSPTCTVLRSKAQQQC
jgi:hypothetical protein